jgi:hypothetical protein
MKTFAALLLFSATLAAQDVDKKPNLEPMFAKVRSADSTQRVTMHVSSKGQLFESLDVAEGEVGSVSLKGGSGTATGVVVAELTTRPGALTFSSALNGPDLEVTVWPRSGAAVPRLWARGRTVRVVRDSSTGGLRVEAGWFR